MSVRLGQTAPDFEQDSTQGRIRFYEWLGYSWVSRSNHPKDESQKGSHPGQTGTRANPSS
jgi:alkyl hydroperoxide reductase subunit AhpC